MLIMETLTDKPDWHKKVFDDEIVAKWRAEAMAYPNDELWNAAVSDKVARYGPVKFKPAHYDIMTPEMFDYVSVNPTLSAIDCRGKLQSNECIDSFFYHRSPSVSRSFAAKPDTMRRRVLYQR